MRRRQKEKEEGEEKVDVDKGRRPALSEEKGAQPGTSSLGEGSLADRIKCLQKQDFEGWFKNAGLCCVYYWFQTDLNLGERKVVTTSLWPFLVWPRPSLTNSCIQKMTGHSELCFWLFRRPREEFGGYEVVGRGTPHSSASR